MGTSEEKLNPIPISEVVPDYKHAMDLRGTPTSVCVCGSTVFKVNCMFDGEGISMYFLDMECTLCGSKATAPTPIDGEED
jgi:hypothetical protein